MEEEENVYGMAHEMKNFKQKKRKLVPSQLSPSPLDEKLNQRGNDDNYKGPQCSVLYRGTENH